MGQKKEIINGCIVVIGDEILSGRTQDLNINYISRQCNDVGIRISEARVIPDNERVIIETLKSCKSTYNYVFTTGGIGPTHDDITSACIAKLFEVPLRRNPQAVEAMEKYYKKTHLNEARLKMADIPEGAILIDNHVSGAPGFNIENIYVLPGIPAILQPMVDSIVPQLTGGEPLLSASIITGLAESVIAEHLSTIQAAYPEVSIGSYPFVRNNHFGVNLVTRSTDEYQLNKVCDEIKSAIKELKGTIIE